LAFRQRWAVLIAWVTLLVVLGAGGQAIKEDLSDAFNVPGTESQRALDLLDEKFPGTGGATARIVFAAPDGHKLTEQRYQKVVQPTIERAQAVPQAITTGKQFAAALQLSRDKKVAFSDLQFEVPVEDLEDSTKEALERVAGPARAAGLTVAFSGGVVSTSAGEGPNTEAIGVIVAFFVLLVVFGGRGSSPGCRWSPR
jgi:putative drug exporter of the RND superfamily